MAPLSFKSNGSMLLCSAVGYSNSDPEHSSEIFTLIATDSNVPFKIHESFLRPVSPTVATMCDGERTIHFKEDVLESTLFAFVHWAHTKDYPDRRPTAGDTQSTSEWDSGNDNFATHVLQWHLTVYMFGGRYDIRGLQDLAKVKLFDHLQSIEELTEKYLGRAVIDLLDRSFMVLPESDPILPHLASYASLNIEYLKLYKKRFGRLLGVADGALARRLFPIHQ
ncbi:MAG: hypothetical protein M1840_005145 [Geoglossum simile]|nr:MAG: hypothetical protein M1840_005145 [Geoglossum simile]